MSSLMSSSLPPFSSTLSSYSAISGSNIITRGKSSVIGTIVSAPIRGYYYPGRVKSIKKTIDSPTTVTSATSINGCSSNNSSSGNSSNGTLVYSIQFSNNLDESILDSMDKIESSIDFNSEQQDQGLILDFSADQLIGRGFEPITRALLSENQKVFITYRSRECSAHVIEHNTDSDDVTLSIDTPGSSSLSFSFPTTTNSLSSSNHYHHHHNNNYNNDQASEIHTVKLQEIRLLPSRKSARIQEHPDYSLLANNGRRSPDEEVSSYTSNAKSSSPSSQNSNNNNNNNLFNKSGRGQRQRTVSGSSILAGSNDSFHSFNNNNNNNNNQQFNILNGKPIVSSAHIDVPQRCFTSATTPGRKRRTTTTTSSAAAAGSNTANRGDVLPTLAILNNNSINGSSNNALLNGSSDTMDECAAALVLMSLSASPRSPTLFNEQQTTSKLYKCTWPGCKHHTRILHEIEQHVRVDHLQKQNDDEEMMSGDEDFYYTEVDESTIATTEHPTLQNYPIGTASTAFSEAINNGPIGGGGWKSSHHHYQPAFTINNYNNNFSSGPESPISLSEADAASSSSSSSVLMAIGDNSMDSSSNPPSPITIQNHQYHLVSTSHFAQQPHQHQQHPAFSSASTFIPVQNQYRHLEDHEYNRKPDPAGVSILGNGTGTVVNRRGRKPTTNPINIPTIDNNNSQSASSFGVNGNGIGGEFNSAASSFSSGFGSYTSSLGSSSLSPISPTSRSHSGSFSSSSSTNNKHLRILSNGRNGSNSGSLGSPLSPSTNSNGANATLLVNRTSPTKRVRGETRKCRKVYGMDRRDSWCTQCKWKKACSRFTD